MPPASQTRVSPPLAAADWPDLALSLSVLSPAELFPVRDEADLLARLRPGIDGLILRDGARRATFLPQVLAQLPDPHAFISQLRRKAAGAGPLVRHTAIRVVFDAMFRAPGGPAALGLVQSGNTLLRTRHKPFPADIYAVSSDDPHPPEIAIAC